MSAKIPEGSDGGQGWIITLLNEELADRNRKVARLGVLLDDAWRLIKVQEQRIDGAWAVVAQAQRVMDAQAQQIAGLDWRLAKGKEKELLERRLALLNAQRIRSERKIARLQRSRPISAKNAAAARAALAEQRAQPAVKRERHRLRAKALLLILQHPKGGQTAVAKSMGISRGKLRRLLTGP